jgi:hypothetical protein
MRVHLQPYIGCTGSGYVSKVRLPQKSPRHQPAGFCGAAICAEESGKALSRRHSLRATGQIQSPYERSAHRAGFQSWIVAKGRYVAHFSSRRLKRTTTSYARTTAATILNGTPILRRTSSASYTPKSAFCMQVCRRIRKCHPLPCRRMAEHLDRCQQPLSKCRKTLNCDCAPALIQAGQRSYRICQSTFAQPFQSRPAAKNSKALLLPGHYELAPRTVPDFPGGAICF